MPEALAQITTLHNKKAQQAGFAKFRTSFRPMYSDISTLR